VILVDLGSSRPGSVPFVLREAGDFQRLLEHHAPSLMLDLPGQIGGDPTGLEVRLTMKRLKDLTPAGLVAQTAPLEQLHRFIGQLQEVEQGERPVESLETLLDEHADLDGMGQVFRLCREELAAGGKDQQQPSPASPGPRDDTESAADEDTDTDTDSASVDRILQMVDLPPPEARATEAIGGVISSVARGTRPASPETTTRLGQAIELAAQRLCAQLDAIYAHPELERVETIWRGLRFLVNRTDFRERIRLEVIHLPRRELADAFHATVTEPELVGSNDPVSLILAAYSFSEPTVDAGLFQRLGEEAELLQAPLILSLGAGFLDLPVGSAGQLRFPSSLLDRPGLVKWNTLRGKPSSRWLAAVFNRFLLAEPLAESVLGLPAGAKLATRHLWGDPVFAVASLVTRSFAETGWPTEISGGRNGTVEDLPLRRVQLEPQRSAQLPVEHLVPQQTVEDLSRAGVVSLFARPDSDEAVVLRAPTLFQEQIANQPTTRGRSISLGYQLMAGRIAQALSVFLPDLTGLDSRESIRDELDRFLRELIVDTGPGARVEVEVRPASRTGEERYVVSLGVRTGNAVLRGAELELEFTI
jgi:type VI secretion system protein ImpC